MRRLRAAFAALALVAVACDPEKPPPKNPRAPVCPPPPEPARQSVVVGSIGKLHMVESRYPITKLGDVMAAFKPDVVLLAMRVEPFRAGEWEDGSFEMTYVAELAKNRAIPVEPINWFRDEDLGVPPPPVEPSDEVEIARREADVLLQPELYTFERANSAELEERVFLATTAEARHRSGNAPWARRNAWMQHLATNAVLRHDRPRRVLAVVDVLDRPFVDLSLRAVGYHATDPVALLAKASEVMVPDIPREAIARWDEQLGRVRERAAKANDAEKAFWEERQRVLEVVVEKKATCCVTQPALEPPRR